MKSIVEFITLGQGVTNHSKIRFWTHEHLDYLVTHEISTIDFQTSHQKLVEIHTKMGP